ncbi:MAG: tripartite tricarboxylate transporter substrate binding protein [Betaproteobacteria bacterium]|nr:tripartite tricarboxylate transporter substrate binding protein [Betaproteobacteria bacterium]
MKKGVHWCGAVLLAVSMPYAHAQKFPDRPIRIVIPFTAGSATDFFARTIGPKLYESWGQQVVVDNRPAAGGTVAGEIVARAAPDGHTWVLHSSGFASAAALYPKLPYDSYKDFSGVTQVASNPLVVLVAPNLGVKTVKDLIALARQKPGQLNFGSSGIGSGSHYGGELFRLVAGIQMTHVPYRGSPEVITDVMAGRLHVSFSPMPPSVPLINAGRVTAIAVTTKKRSHVLPDVPAVAEAGLPDYEYDGWFGIFVPSATPRPVVAQISREVARVVALKDVSGLFMKQGATPLTSEPAAFEKMVYAEIATRRKVFAAAGVKPE